MTRLLRSLLIWLLVLALPAQAAAVAAMVGCGPRQPAAAVVGSGLGHGAQLAAHAHAAGQAAHRHAAGQAAHDHAGGQAAHHHADGPASAGPDDTAQALAGGPAPDAKAAASTDAHKCSACASCCAAGAILNTVPTVPMPEFAAAVFADWAASVAPFAVDGPERPPRRILA